MIEKKIDDKNLRIVLVGVGGYGVHYVKDLIERQNTGRDIVGIVDPMAEKSPIWPALSYFDRYDDLSVCLKEKKADLVFISSPIQYHEKQVLTALDHGAHVLCEKPLCATSRQGQRIIEKSNKTGLHVAVGFQWSFNPIIQKAKQDVMDGRYGQPVTMRTVMHWPRSIAYYQRNSWAGKKEDRQGQPVFDSVISNATAHYLHNMLFFLGSTMDEAAMPEHIEGRLWRGQLIENFDTAFVKMKKELPNQKYVDMMMIASHLTEEERPPFFEFTYEKGRIFMDQDILKGEIYADSPEQISEKFEYGHPQGGQDVARKIDAAIKAARTGEKPVCDARTAFPHIRVISWLQENCDIMQIPADLLKMKEHHNTQWYYLPGLDQLMDEAAMQLKLPDHFVK